MTEPTCRDEPTTGDVKATRPFSVQPERFDPSGDPGFDGVAALAPGMGGVWEVETHSSLHVWDLDAFTYLRIPDRWGRRADGDGVPHRITSVVAWPAVGSVAHLVYDDPLDPERVEQWRQSATIVSIRRRPTPARPDRARGSSPTSQQPPDRL